MTRLLAGFFASALASVAFSVCHAGGLEKGNLLSVHIMSVTLKPNVTLEQFEAAFVREVLPEYDKNWPGLHGYLLKPFFRDSKNQFAIVWLFTTVADRNRNFDANDRANELERAALAKLRPIEDRFKQRYGNYTVAYTHDDDWVVQ
jgi:hypothetical protein